MAFDRGGRPPQGTRQGPGRTTGVTGTPPTLEEFKPCYHEAGHIRPELLDAEAEDQARRMSAVAASQLRKHYEIVLDIRQRLDQAAGDPEGRAAAFAALRAEVRMLRARAHYLVGRASGERNRDAMKALGEFLASHARAVDTAADFDAFCQHFQAVVAFHRFYCTDRKK